jgi:hypothetical protein
MLEPREENMQRVIVCAAALNPTFNTVVLGVRHGDEFMCDVLESSTRWDFDADDIQGFIDNKRVFLTRTEAWQVAEAAGQIKRRCGGDTADGGTLYSENLY